MATQTTSRLRPYRSQADAFKDGSSTPSAFLADCIETIKALEPSIEAFVELNLDAAIEAAEAASKRWAAGAPLSLIDGMPVGIKDIIETADMVTEQGSQLFLGWRGSRDSASVAALREAGAVVVGKTVTTEFAGMAPGPTRNPWDTERTPGGSSSGSGAAVGSRMLPAALGTQVVGSILRPSSYCGCYGFKPSVGGINRGGSFDYFSQSCTGVLAASLADAWCVARAMSSIVGGDPGHVGLTGPSDLPPSTTPTRLALLETAGWQRTSDEAKLELEAALSVLRSAGVEIVAGEANAAVAGADAAISNAAELSRAVCDWESRWPLNTYSRDLDHSKLSQASQERLARAEAMTQDDYQVAFRERESARATFAKLSAQFDACITLSAPAAAPVGIEWTGDTVFVAPASLLGTPSVSLPLLLDGGLPLGLQLLGFENADASLISTAAGVESLLEAE